MSAVQDDYSPGLEGVIAGETGVSTVSDGLRYRGYAIEELARQSSFEEVAYLILYGELPNLAEFGQFKARLAAARPIPDEIVELYRRIPSGTPAMDVLRTGVSLLAHFDPDVGSNEAEPNLRKAERLIAQIATLVAARARIVGGLDPLDSRDDLDHAANFLYMLSGEAPDDSHRRALDVSLILYAEHEFNASTFTARVTASTLADLHSAIVAAIGALKGPLHGGANERVVGILQEISTADRAEPWIRDALARRQLVMGFGHRIYKERDPRADILKELCAELARAPEQLEWERIAHTVETIMWDEKHLPANMDWPAGRLYHLIGLEVELYTPLFVASRVSGWAAHVIEQHANNRLMRPRARYVGAEPRRYAGLESRG